VVSRVKDVAGGEKRSRFRSEQLKIERFRRKRSILVLATRVGWLFQEFADV
jgi:hypothetical protein